MGATSSWYKKSAGERKLDSYGFIKMVVASNSNLFIDVICKILGSNIKIVVEGLNLEGIGKCLGETKPQFLLVDNRTHELDVYELSNLVAEKYPCYILLFGSLFTNEFNLPNVTYIAGETIPAELVQIINGAKTKKVSHLDKVYLTDAEAKLAKLVVAGLTNREIAKKLGIRETTVRKHFYNIFHKLGIKNRYQLIVYLKHLKHQN